MHYTKNPLVCQIQYLTDFTAIVLSMYMLLSILLILCDLFECKRICEGFYCLFISVLLKIQLSEGERWDLINLFNHVTLFSLSKHRTKISSAI